MTDLQQLAAFLAKQGASQEAEKYFRKAIKIGENLPSPNKTVFVALMSGLADLLVEQDELDEAERLYTRATDICEGSFGHEHQLANTLNSRALLAERQSDYQEARELYDRVIRIADDFQAASEDRTVYLTNLADMLKCQGGFDKVDSFYGRALKIDEEKYGLRHLEVATDLEKRGRPMIVWRKHSEAVKLFERALDMRKAELGDQHQATATLKHLLDNDCHPGSGKNAAAMSVV